MKNYRGTALASVRATIWKTFGVERLPVLPSNPSVADIIAWKQAPETIACFDALFEKNNDNVYWISVIARVAFNEATVPNLSYTHCAFTMAVCDIFLNPAFKAIVCTEKRMKRRMACYIVSYR